MVRRAYRERPGRGRGRPGSLSGGGLGGRIPTRMKALADPPTLGGPTLPRISTSLIMLPPFPRFKSLADSLNVPGRISQKKHAEKGGREGEASGCRAGGGPGGGAGWAAGLARRPRTSAGAPVPSAQVIKKHLCSSVRLRVRGAPAPRRRVGARPPRARRAALGLRAASPRGTREAWEPQLHGTCLKMAEAPPPPRTLKSGSTSRRASLPTLTPMPAFSQTNSLYPHENQWMEQIVLNYVK